MMLMEKEQCKQCFHYQMCANVLKQQLYIRETLLKEENPKCKCFVSTADVVPRSEVEKYIVNMNAYGLTAKRLAEENERLQAQVNRLKTYDEERDIALHQRLVREAKQEVAREIFAEIRKEIELALESNYKVLNEHGDKDNAIFNELINRVKGKIDSLRGIDDFIDELEKKHIGE